MIDPFYLIDSSRLDFPALLGAAQRNRPVSDIKTQDLYGLGWGAADLAVVKLKPMFW